MAADFTLCKNAFFVAMDKFKGILDGNDVGVTPFIDIIDNGSKGCRLAASCGAGHQNQALGEFSDVFDCLRQL